VPTEHIPTISPNDRWAIRYELGWYAPIQYTILCRPHKFSLVCHGHVVTANCNSVHACVRACMVLYTANALGYLFLNQRHGCAVILQSWDSLCDCRVIWICVKSFGPLLAKFSYQLSRSSGTRWDIHSYKLSRSSGTRWDIHSYKLHTLMVGFTHHVCVSGGSDQECGKNISNE